MLLSFRQKFEDEWRQFAKENRNLRLADFTEFTQKFIVDNEVAMKGIMRARWRESKRKYRIAHRAECNEMQKNWARNHPEKVREYSRKSRLKKKERLKNAI